MVSVRKLLTMRIHTIAVIFPRNLLVEVVCTRVGNVKMVPGANRKLFNIRVSALEK